MTKEDNGINSKYVHSEVEYEGKVYPITALIKARDLCRYDISITYSVYGTELTVYSYTPPSAIPVHIDSVQHSKTYKLLMRLTDGDIRSRVNNHKTKESK